MPPRLDRTRLRPLNDESLVYGEGYRGHRYVQWRVATTKRKTDRIFEEYASGCRFCGQYWGWTFDLQQALRLACAMGIKGCPHCEKRLSKKKHSALREHVKNSRVRICTDVFVWNGRKAFGCDFCKNRIGKDTYKKVQKIMRKKLAS